MSRECLSIAAFLLFSAAGAAASSPAEDAANLASKGWDKAAAARYLDGREVWWQEWPHAQKDHGTVCLSCHTQVPYALGRTALHGETGDGKLADPERAMLDSILTRVKLGERAETFYSDAVDGPGKTHEARNTEGVFNALILACYDSVGLLPDVEGKGAKSETGGTMSAITRTAFDRMWASQEKTGSKAGAWIWQNFHFSPWEAPESEYYGATMAAVAVGTVPGSYRDGTHVRPSVELLRGYLRREAPNQPLANRALLLWASSRLGGLVSAAERQALVAELVAKQHADGGWSLAELGSSPRGEVAWKRQDKSPFDERSDGYATGLVVLAIEDTDGGELDGPAGKGESAVVARGLAWLGANQDGAGGGWSASSLNVKRDPASGVGKFMSDAATGFAVLALERSRTGDGPKTGGPGKAGAGAGVAGTAGR